MLDHPYLTRPRVLRSLRVPRMSAEVPRLWPDLPIAIQILLAKQMAQLLGRMLHPPLLTKEGRYADGGDGD